MDIVVRERKDVLCSLCIQAFLYEFVVKAQSEAINAKEVLLQADTCAHAHNHTYTDRIFISWGEKV